MDTLKTTVLSCRPSLTGLKVDSQPQVAATRETLDDWIL